MSAGLVLVIATLMHNDFLYKLPQQSRGKFFKAGMSPDTIHKPFCVHGDFLCFGKLRLDSSGSFFQFRVTLMCLYNRVIGENPVTHGTTPPFPLSAASRQAGYAARLCCVSSRFVLRFLSASSAGSNTKRFPLASVPAAGQEPLQGNGCLKVSSAPGQRIDKFRHSPALRNTRLWCLAGQTFPRSNIQGRFPVSTLPPAYGQRQRTHSE